MWRLTCAQILILIAMSSEARDLWIVQGKATTPVNRCDVVAWAAGGLLHNTTDRPLEAEVLHVSNGGGPVPHQPRLHVPPHRSVPAHPRGANPFVGPSLYVMRINAPEEIAAEARLDLWNLNDCVALSPPPTLPFAKISMPVFDRLVPPGEKQVITGTDLAGQQSRLNVGIYNAGDLEAAAVIAVHAPFCTETNLGETMTRIPADTIVQVRVEFRQPCGGDPEFPGWSTYVTVTVDQPSLSFVSVLSNDAAPAVTSTVVGPGR